MKKIRKPSNPIQLVIKKRGYRVLLTPTKQETKEKDWNKNKMRYLSNFV